MRAKTKTVAEGERIVLYHETGRTQTVEFWGFRGIPLRPLINWPLNGQYKVSLRDGTLIDGAEHAAALRRWKVDAPTLRALRRQRHALEVRKQVPVA